MLYFRSTMILSIKNIFDRSKWYFSASLVLIALLLILLLTFGKIKSFVLLNSFHSDFLDWFFIVFTNVGDGIFAILLALIALLVYRNKTPGLAIIYSFLVSGILAQLMKRIVEAPRPGLIFQDTDYTKFVEGVKLAFYHSFPSGHTATAFAIVTVIATLMRSRKWQLQLLILATLVGFSRIYLGQHFLEDTIAGAGIGILSGVVAIYLANNYPWLNKFLKRKWENPISNPDQDHQFI